MGGAGLSDDAAGPGAAAGTDAEAGAGADGLARVEELFASLVDMAMASTQGRCPYKNRLDRCTAAFGCRNQRRPSEEGGLRVCSAADGTLDYRSAWETDPD